MKEKVTKKGIVIMLCIVYGIVQVLAQVKIPLPEKLNFEASNLLLVSDGDNELGLLAKEYVVLEGKGQTLTLLYLPKENREIDFSVGYRIDQAKKVLHNTSNNTSAEETVGEIWQGALFLTNKGNLSYAPIDGAQEVLIKPFLLEDKRGDETEHYALVKVGLQIWMRDNLRTGRFNDGSTIVTNLPKDQWEKSKSPAMTYYDGNKDNKDKMGALYNWYAVENAISIAPKGWIVPRMEDWESLAKYIDPKGAMTFDYETASLSYTAGEMLKSKTEWVKPSTATGQLLPGNNATMLDMKAYGSTSTSKYFNGYSGLNRQGYFWTSTVSDYSDTKALFIRLYWDSHTINSYMEDKFMGYSVRCILQAPLPLSPWQEVNKEELSLNVSKAGELASLVKPDQFTMVKSLTISGTLDARDFRTLRRFDQLQTLNLSNISIDAYNGTEGTLEGSKVYNKEEIPAESFKGMTSLVSFSASGTLLALGAGTFEGCSALAQVVLPKSLKKLGGSNFLNCTSLSSLTLPSQVEDLGIATFKGCTALGTISLPNTITQIKEEVFNSCQSLTRITFSPNIKEIGASAFNKCTSLSEIALPNQITKIGDLSFAHCSKLKSIALSNAITEIGTSAFLNNADLNELHLPDGLNKIGNFAFEGCTSLTRLALPSSLSYLGDGAFKGTAIQFNLPENSLYKLHNGMLMSRDNKTVYNLPVNYAQPVVIPEGVETLAGSAFFGCKSLTHIDLPSTLKKIKAAALSNTALFHIVLRVNDPANITLEENVFGTMDYTRCELLVPEASFDLYQTIAPWNLFKLSKITATTIIDSTPIKVAVKKEAIMVVVPEEYLGEMIHLYTIDGRLIFSLQIQTEEVQVSTSNFFRGAYFLKVGKTSQKLYIQ